MFRWEEEGTESTAQKWYWRASLSPSSFEFPLILGVAIQNPHRVFGSSQDTKLDPACTEQRGPYSLAAGSEFGLVEVKELIFL